jgi:hypothetical protein
MDFSKAIELQTASSTYININSLTSSSPNAVLSGYMVEGIQYTGSTVSGYVDGMAQRDGVDTDIAVLGPRQVQLIVQVYGSTGADFYDKLDTLNSALQPYPSFATSDDGFRQLRFTQPTISYAALSASGIPMYMKLRPTSLPGYALNNDRVTPLKAGKGVAAKVNVAMFAKDPRKIHQTTSSGSLGVSTTTTSSTAVTNNGNYFAYPTMIITSSRTVAQTATISSSLWTCVVSVPASTTVTIDSIYRTVKVGTTLRMDLLLSGTTSTPYLVSGSNSLTVSALTSTTVTYSFQEAWI